MTKKKYMLIFTAFLFSCMIYGQKTIKDKNETGAEIIERISDFWKLDSLANNGFRFCSYKNLIKSKPGKINRAFLLEKLGKPNHIRESNKGTEYIYYYYDESQLLKKEDRTNLCRFIIFNFDKYDKYVSSIQYGSGNVSLSSVL